MNCRCLILVLLTLFLGLALPAEEVGVVTFVSGKVYLDSKQKKPIKFKQILKKGDRIVSESGECEVSLAGRSRFRLSPNSSIDLEEILDTESNSTWLKLVAGKVFVDVPKLSGGSFQISLPGFVAGVRGTQFIASSPHSRDSSDNLNLETGIFVAEGRVEVGKSTPETLSAKNQTQKVKKREFLGSTDEVVAVSAGEQVVLKGQALQKGILEDYAKEKMKIFKEFQDFKEENYLLYKEQFLRNLENIERMRKR